MARTLLVLRADAAAVYRLSAGTLPPSLGRDRGADGGLRGTAVDDESRGRCHQPLPLQLHGRYAALRPRPALCPLWRRAATGTLVAIIVGRRLHPVVSAHLCLQPVVQPVGSGSRHHLRRSHLHGQVDSRLVAESGPPRALRARMDGPDISCTLRMSPHSAQDAHPHKSPRRHLHRVVALPNSLDMSGMALPPADEQDT